MKFTHTEFGETFSLVPQFGKYASGDKLAIQLFDEVDGPFATVTVNIDGVNLGTHEVLIKAWSENESIVARMVELGYLNPTGRTAATGYVEAEVMTMAGDLLAEAVEYLKGRS